MTWQRPRGTNGGSIRDFGADVTRSNRPRVDPKRGMGGPRDGPDMQNRTKARVT